MFEMSVFLILRPNIRREILFVVTSIANVLAVLFNTQPSQKSFVALVKNAAPFTLAPESHSETSSRAKESAFWSSFSHDFDEMVCGPLFKKSCC